MEGELFYPSPTASDVDDDAFVPAPSPSENELRSNIRNSLEVKPKRIHVEDNWRNDPILEESIESIDCMFTSVDIKDALDFDLSKLAQPIILRGFMDSWTASKHWSDRFTIDIKWLPIFLKYIHLHNL